MSSAPKSFCILKLITLDDKKPCVFSLKPLRGFYVGGQPHHLPLLAVVQLYEYTPQLLTDCDEEERARSRLENTL